MRGRDCTPKKAGEEGAENHLNIFSKWFWKEAVPCFPFPPMSVTDQLQSHAGTYTCVSALYFYSTKIPTPVVGTMIGKRNVFLGHLEQRSQDSGVAPSTLLLLQGSSFESPLKTSLSPGNEASSPQGSIPLGHRRAEARRWVGPYVTVEGVPRDSPWQ